MLVKSFIEMNRLLIFLLACFFNIFFNQNLSSEEDFDQLYFSQSSSGGIGLLENPEFEPYPDGLDIEQKRLNDLEDSNDTGI